MGTEWRDWLRVDPIAALLREKDEALRFFVRRDLLDESPGDASRLQPLAEVQKITRRQQADGAWKHAGENRHPATNPNLVETWRWMRVLVEQYGQTRAWEPVTKAAEYMFSCQTASGDLRGMLGNQYATYYTGAMLSTLIQAGYADDPRVERGLAWLLAMRQSDGGWSVPMITHRFTRVEQYRLTTEDVESVEPDRAKPFSHNWTGMVLRAFAAHPRYRRSPEAVAAATLLKSRLFQPDVYTSYQSADYWVRFDFPFWWNHLVAVLDTLSKIGIPAEDEHVRSGTEWLIEHQQDNGFWKISYVRDAGTEKERARLASLWITLAICQVLKRFSEG